MNGMTPVESGSSSVTTSTWPGRSEDLFADDAINKVHEASCGKPRTVNNLVVAALIATCGRQESRRSVRRPLRHQGGHISRMSIPPTP